MVEVEQVTERVTMGEAETVALAASLASGFRGGEVVLLHGELGSGKTAFVRGLAKGLGGDPEAVTSPTFVLLTAYRGRLTLHHADLYRLDSVGPQDELGLEQLPGGGVLAVEWADRIIDPAWPRQIVVRLEHAGGNRRRITVDERPR